MKADLPGNLHFAGWTLNLARLSLEREGREIFLRPKSFEVLRYLAANSGRVVTKDELMERVWSGTVVTDDSLVQCIKDIREAICDQERRIVKTLPRRGYLFAAVVTDGANPPISADSVSPIRFAKSCEVHIAYRVWGEGPRHLVFCPGFVTHIENAWTEPSMARFLRRMGQFARVVMFDKRGTGMSDGVERVPGLDARVDDLRAVLDAVGVERAAIIGPPKAARSPPISPPRSRAAAKRSCSMVRSRTLPLGSEAKRPCRDCCNISIRVGAAARACPCSLPRWSEMRHSKNGGDDTSGSARLPPPPWRLCVSTARSISPVSFPASVFRPWSFTERETPALILKGGGSLPPAYRTHVWSNSLALIISPGRATTLMRFFGSLKNF
ncbi:winged helix-turn-helix domain-containing protein [Mesorhizobium sp. WSM4935]|nr:winged helix-turn-helix domain-containing protein [Mesorhizobium sp. WSM4935]MDG4877263.1 winged helix-turn-helix domain-containing protein [Mesorhizobium sp. WSM4935]